MSALLITTLVSWIRESRGPTGLAAGRGTWLLTLPVRVKVIVLLLSLPFTAWLTLKLWTPLPLGVPRSVDSALRLAGLVLFAAGEVLTIWGRISLGRMWALSTTFGVRLHEKHRLIRDGPFAIVRHPMYLGFCALLAGIVLLYRTWAVGLYLVFSLLVFPRRARLEERALEAVFGEEWRDYARRVAMWIPGWPRRH